MSRYKPAATTSGGVGALKTFTTTLAAPRETLIGTPVALPTSAPTNAQISLTVQSSDLPTIEPSPISVKYTALVYVGGKNTDASSQTVSYTIYKNTVQVATGSQTGLTTNTFWTHGHFQFFDVVVGDVLEVKIWSTSANVNYDYYSIVVYPTRMNLGSAYVNKDVFYSNFISNSLTSGTPAIQISQSFNIYPSDSTTTGMQLGSNTNFGSLHWNATYFTGRVQWGDVSLSSSTLSSSTARPYYTRNNIPSTISFHEVTT